jgi:antitoxin component of MazEF toxin-antitoxin module
VTLPQASADEAQLAIGDDLEVEVVGDGVVVLKKRT